MSRSVIIKNKILFAVLGGVVSFVSYFFWKEHSFINFLFKPPCSNSVIFFRYVIFLDNEGYDLWNVKQINLLFQNNFIKQLHNF